MTDAPRTRTMPTTFARLEAANKRLTEENKALLLWSKEAYTRLNALMSIGVSMTPDAVTKQLLEDAPETVKGGENPSKSAG